MITQEEEAKYLAAAGEPLGSLATVLVDTGLRPEECFRLRWEDISFSGGRYGTLRVLQGKTKAARRTLPLSARVRELLSTRWESAGKPNDGWIWPAPTKQGQIWHDSIRVQHKRAIEKSRVKKFVIYSPLPPAGLVPGSASATARTNAAVRPASDSYSATEPRPGVLSAQGHSREHALAAAHD